MHRGYSEFEPALTPLLLKAAAAAAPPPPKPGHPPPTPETDQARSPRLRVLSALA